MPKTSELPRFLPPASPSPEEPEVFVMPCSTSQKRFWMLEQISPGNTALSIPIALQLNGPLRLDILEQALNAIVTRHEILRTSFGVIEDEPHQIIAPTAQLKINLLDRANLLPEQHEEEVRREMKLEANRPLSLNQAPLLRATLLKLSAQEHVLMLTAHHIISDGWSSGVLVRELGRFYEALRQGTAADLPPLSIQYADYVLWQEEWMKTPELPRQLDYWRGALSGSLPALDFPTDFTRGTGSDQEAILESLLLPTTLSEALRRFCLEEGATLFMLFFSAYAVVLHRYTGQTSFLIGTTVANRNQAELEEVIGLFANLLILRSELSPTTTFREFLSQQRDQSLSSFANHETPFELVLEQLQRGRNGSFSTLLQTHFLYQRAFMQPTTAGELAISPLRSVSPGSGFELTFGIVERKEGIRLQMEYRTSLFQAQTIRRLLQHFQGVLESIVAHPDSTLADLSLFTGNERETLASHLVEVTRPMKQTPRPEEFLQDLERQLEIHLQSGSGPFTHAIQTPPGLALIALDSRCRLLPCGVPGDLYLASQSADSLASLGLEIIPEPLEVEAKLYLVRTGLIGRNADDSGVQLWGHSEDLVRLPVHRFNLKTVEARLRLHPEVAEAAVAFHPEFPDHTKLAAYVVLRPGAKVTGGDLRTFLRDQMSSFAVPHVIAVLKSLPKRCDGRVATEELPPMAPALSNPDLTSPSMSGILQQQLIELWQQILKTTGLTIHDNFFECGGSSLLALRMMTEAGKLCGRSLPLTLLLKGATVSNLARFIIHAHQESETATPLIVLQPQGTRPPIFFLHGDWAGGGFYCQRLSEHLGADQPFFVLPPYRSPLSSLLSIPEMAAFHLASIRKQLPSGPFVLGGYCIGATIALEIARQMKAEGQTVSHLLLVDPPIWVSPWLRRLWPVVDLLGGLFKWDLKKRISLFDRYAVPFTRWWQKPLKSKLEMARRRAGFPRPPGELEATSSSPESEDNDVLKSFEYALYFLAYRLYRLRPLSVSATFYFPASTQEQRLVNVRTASQLDASNYSIEMLPGDHTTCVANHTAALAEKIKKTLEKI